MKQVIAFIKPHQLSPVAMGLRDIPGLTGNGKIYVTDVAEAMRISNGERGASAV